MAEIKEKVYITRDEESEKICVWRKPTKGNWSPEPIKGSDQVIFMREEVNMQTMDIYIADDFKKKFGITIRPKTKKCVHLPSDLLKNDDFKLFSNNPNRKK